MIQLNDDLLKRIHDVELEMLLEVDRICRKHNIQYTLVGGTLLGAVRHGGFIPWDDDADVGMLRSEYNRFVEACQTELDHDRFFLQDHNSDPSYRWGYSKLRRKNSLFLRSGQEHMDMHQGIFLDIFIYDAAATSYVGKRLQRLFHWYIRKTMYSAVGRKSAPRPRWRFFYNVLYHHMSIEKTFQKLEKSVAKHNKAIGIRGYLHATMPHNKVHRYGIPAWFFHNIEDIQFEGHTLRGMVKRHTYCGQAFGHGYMEIPPAHVRKIHGVSKLRFPDGYELTDEEQALTFNEETLLKVRKVQLQLLAELDRICRKHEIEYSLEGDTLLGAVRHGGYLPLADDIQVCMRGNKYKWMRVYKEELKDSPFLFQEYGLEWPYRSFHDQLSYRDADFVLKGWEQTKVQKFVCIKINHYFNIPDNPIVRGWYHLVDWFTRQCLYAEVGHWVAKTWAGQLYYAALFRVQKHHLAVRRQKMINRGNKKKTKRVRAYGSMIAPCFGKDIPASCFRAYQDISFEGLTVRAVADTDTYLTTRYGKGYMTSDKPKRKLSEISLLRLPKGCQEP